jgi:acyl dehydratase
MLHLEDLAVGQTWTTPSRLISESDVFAFANMTGDRNPLHLDVAYAAQTPYRQRVAHGLLGLSWVAGLASQHPQVETTAFVGIRNWEFLRPVFFNDSVHAEVRIVDIDPKGRRTGRVSWLMQLVNQRGEVTQQGLFETLVARAQPLPRHHLRKSIEDVQPTPAPAGQPPHVE